VRGDSDDKDGMREILEAFRDGKLGTEEALKRLTEFHYLDLGCAKLDTHRESRVGYPEVIYCPGKTARQVATIIKAMLKRGSNVLATKASEDQYEAVRKLSKAAVFNPLAKTISIRKKQIDSPQSYIAIVTAGTSDLPVAEEAAVTAEFFGNRVERVIDVGVAGIHRLFDNMAVIRGARVIVVVAGMEGALPSIVGGLVDKPVIAVPTSVGYGASFQGLAALLTMLNSCASGVCVVNIDNGFGAGYMASMINRL